MVGPSGGKSGKSPTKAARAIAALRRGCKAARLRDETQERIEIEERMPAGYLSHLLAGRWRPGRDFAEAIERRLGVPVALWKRKRRRKRAA